VRLQLATFKQETVEVLFCASPCSYSMVQWL